MISEDYLQAIFLCISNILLVHHISWSHRLLSRFSGIQEHDLEADNNGFLPSSLRFIELILLLHGKVR
jgi:hypothetical protein